MKWIDNIPLPLLAVVGIFLLFAPFQPEPHLVQKLRMLSSGELSKAMDIFDLFWHSVPFSLLLIRLYRQYIKK